MKKILSQTQNLVFTHKLVAYIILLMEYNILNNLSTNKSARPDNIPNFILILCSVDISPVLHDIFTQSFKNWSLTTDWLSGHTIPIF